MSPFAYGVRDHEIFRQPRSVDVTRTVTRPTPEPWSAHLDAEEVAVLPLVDGERGSIGWCTAAFTLDMPDVEVFCGGINTKLPSHAGLWRQGNLLHFGFEPAPSELNEAGRSLLLNSLAYIARFTEDRPIALTPSPFSSRPFVTSMRFVERALDDPAATSERVAGFFVSPWKEKLEALAPDEAKAFVRTNATAIRAEGTDLAFDADALEWDLPLTQPAFLEGIAKHLDTDPDRAAALLRRMVPQGPGEDADWGSWLAANRDYLFYCEGAGYVWLFDPLAARRGVPTAELRGTSRADRP